MYRGEIIVALPCPPSISPRACAILRNDRAGSGKNFVDILGFLHGLYMLMKVWPVKTNIVCRDPRNKNNFEHSIAS